jgi:hypothetical protein
MAALFVKVTEIGGAGASVAVSVTSTAGNALLATCGTTIGVASTLTVSGGGTWTTDYDVDVAAVVHDAGFASCPSATGGAQTITVAFTTGASSTSFILEFSGMPSSSMFEANGTTNSGTVTAPTGNVTLSTQALTNSNATDVFVAYVRVANSGGSTWSSTGTGWTLPAGGSDTGAGSPDAAACGYQIVSTAAAQTESWQFNDPGSAHADLWLAIIGCYKQAGAGGGAPAFLNQRTVRGAG